MCTRSMRYYSLLFFITQKKSETRFLEVKKKEEKDLKTNNAVASTDVKEDTRPHPATHKHGPPTCPDP